MAARSPHIPLVRFEDARRTAAGCVHYGMCTAVCPTYVLDGDENDSPRGRIVLIREMLERGGVPREATITHTDRCLSCLSCETSCAAGVNYRTLLDTARELIEASGARPIGDRLFRRALTMMLTSPRLLRGALALGRPLSRLAAAMPGRLGALGRMARAPGISAFTLRHEQAAELSPRAAESGASVRSVALLEGCVQSVLGADINQAARRVLARAGVRVVDTGDSGGCCGAMNLHMGYRTAARRQAAARVNTWHDRLASGDIDAVVVTTSGCGVVIKHYEELFADDPVLASRAAAVAGATRDIAVLANGLRLPSRGGNAGAVVAYHDACSMKHGLKLTREPRRVLRELGFAVADIAEGHLCCGSAGTYNILQPAISERLGRRKAENVMATSPDVIAAGNLGCLIQISRFAPVPVAHSVQLIDWATGGPAPLGLESFQPRPMPVATDGSDAVPYPASNLSPQSQAGAPVNDNTPFW